MIFLRQTKRRNVKKIDGCAFFNEKRILFLDKGVKNVLYKKIGKNGIGKKYLICRKFVIEEKYFMNSGFYF